MRTDDQPPPGKAPTATMGGVSQMVRDVTDLPAVAHLPDELRALPQYADFRELGRGGMGVVYLARNTLLDRLEVLKVAQVRAGRERFLREIQAAARLDHPNVVRAYAAAEQGAALVFAMEYVAGEDLQKVVARKGPLPVPAACFYAFCAATGLQHAHEHGLVHRDIKPANLLLTKVKGKAVVKVTDFGLAKPAADDGGLTGTGVLMGTPDYLAPEQATDAATADTRADIYSLGCTLYCLLAGAPPFRDAAGLMGKVDAHRHRPPKSLTEVRPDVPAELAAVVAKMLAKRREDRYQTPGEVAAAVRPFIVRPNGKGATVVPAAEVARPTVSVAPAATRVLRRRSEGRTLIAKRVRPPARRWPWVVGAVAAVALVAAVAAGVVKRQTANGPAVVTSVPAGAEVPADDRPAVAPNRVERPVAAKPPAPEADRVLAPELSVWAGKYVTTYTNGRVEVGGASWTVIERTGDVVQFTSRYGSGWRQYYFGTINSKGNLTINERKIIRPVVKPKEAMSGTGSVTPRLIQFTSLQDDRTTRGDYVRLPDGGAGFNFLGEWTFADPAGNETHVLTVAEGVLTRSGQGGGTWERDGGILTAHYPNGHPKESIEWFLIDPDDPDKLTGGGGSTFETWTRSPNAKDQRSGAHSSTARRAGLSLLPIKSEWAGPFAVAPPGYHKHPDADSWRRQWGKRLTELESVEVAELSPAARRGAGDGGRDDVVFGAAD